MSDFLKNNIVVLSLVAIFCIGCFFLPSFFTDRVYLHSVLNNYQVTFLNPFFKFVTYLGDGVILVPLILYFMVYKNFNYSIQLLFLSILLVLLAQFFKHFVFEAYDRPYMVFSLLGESLSLVLPESEMHKHHSFPSGHTTTAFALFLYLSFTKFNSIAGKILMFVLALLAGLSRVYLSQHFVQDVVGGAILGTFIALFTYLVFKKLIIQKSKNNRGIIYIFANRNLGL